MVPTEAHIELFRLLMNDPGGEDEVFSDAEIVTLWDAAGGSTSGESMIGARILAIDILLMDSSKRTNYKQNQSSENQSDIFKALNEVRSNLVRERALITAQNGSAARMASTRKHPQRRKEYPWS